MGRGRGLACGVQLGHTFLLGGFSQLADVGREVELKRGEVSRGAVVREKNGWIKGTGSESNRRKRLKQGLESGMCWQ